MHCFSAVANDLMAIHSFVHDTGLLYRRFLSWSSTVLLEHVNSLYMFIYLVICLASKYRNSLRYFDNVATVTNRQPSFDEERRLHQIHPPIHGE